MRKANLLKSETTPVYCAKIKPAGADRKRTVELTDEQIIEAAREILRNRANRMTGSLTSPDLVKAFITDWLLGCEREEFVVLLLDSQHRVIHIESTFAGTINAAPVYPREVIKVTLKHNAAAVILAHNHPSGVTEPSTADQRVTERLKKALALIDVTLLDHFIIDPIGNEPAVSFAERGLL